MLKKIAALFLICAFTIMVATGCGGEANTPMENEPVNLSVSAAASLKDVAEELKILYEAQNTDVTISYNMAGSGTLQQQIENGAPADLFISAGKQQMDTLQEKGLLVDSSRKDLLGNELVLISDKNSELADFEALTEADVEKIAIGTPETVPAGKYAQEVLTSLGLWEQVQDKLVQAQDVRQVLNYVETGNAEAGLVYRTDALASDQVKIVAKAPADSSEPIVYPMAVIKASQHQKEAQEFANFLRSDEAVALFEKYGFTVIR